VEAVDDPQWCEFSHGESRHGGSSTSIAELAYVLALASLRDANGLR